MVRSLGTPTVFFTLGAADLHWPQLNKLLAPDEDLSNESSFARRKQLLNENPLIVETFFNKRVQFLVRELYAQSSMFPLSGSALNGSIEGALTYMYFFGCMKHPTSIYYFKTRF